MPPKKSSRRFASLTRAEVRRTLSENGALPDSTEGLQPDDAIIGQKRAIDALRLGLELYSPGYNVFVCGITGTGRTSTVKRMLKSMKPSCALASDYCYVQNFDDPERPTLLTLPRGKADDFRESVRDMIDLLRETLPRIINSEELKSEREAIEEELREETMGLAQDFEASVQSSGFVLAQRAEGNVVVTELRFVVGEEAVPMALLSRAVAAGQIDQERADQAQVDYKELRKGLGEIVALQQRVQHRLRERLEELEREAVQLSVATAIDDVRRVYGDGGVTEWLDRIEQELVENLEAFRRPAETKPEDDAGPDLSIFDVNIVAHSKSEDCPVIVENHPSYQNLFGSQDRVAIGPGVFATDFSRIRPGSLLRAQGGYVVINAPDLLNEPGVWPMLKRSLRARELIIQGPEGSGGNGPTLQPDPIPLNVKVILIGDARLYSVLLDNDREFGKIFKIKADFDSSIKVGEGHLEAYLGVLVRIAREENLRDFDRSGIDYVLQYSMRLSGQQGRLTTRFSPIADLMREASHIAGKNGSPLVTEVEVREAIRQTWERGSLLEERMSRQIQEGDVRIVSEGRAVGEINGLTVLSTGDYAFGKPARISCQVGAGRIGVINIEREVELSGSSHDKGLLILEGFFVGRFAQKHPLALHASLCFEQSYGPIDGDSASSTEVYALLSSLAGLELRQDLAVTGSVDQFGRVQAVGGLNEKIEGFFKTCSARGLTGDQGCMVPACNVDELMLSAEVCEAIDAGDFHIYPIECIDDGIELLSGVVAGSKDREGNWTKNGVNDLVQRRLDELWEASKLLRD